MALRLKCNGINICTILAVKGQARKEVVREYIYTYIYTDTVKRNMERAYGMHAHCNNRRGISYLRNVGGFSWCYYYVITCRS